MVAEEDHRNNPILSTGRRGDDDDHDGETVNFRRLRCRQLRLLRRRKCQARSRLFAIATIVVALLPTLFPPSALLFCIPGVEFCANAAVFAAATDEDGASSPSYDWETWNYYQILGLEDPPPAPATAPPNDDSPSSVDTKEMQRRRKSVTTSDVKKSYRRQAQRYHPDKIQQQRRRRAGNGTVDDDADDEVSACTAVSSGEGGGGNETCSMSMEEANARFARISEAYQVLSDEGGERDFYDEELGRWEDQRRWEERSRHGNEMKGQQRQRQPHGRRRGGGGGFPWEQEEGGGTGGEGFFFTDPMTVFEQFFSGGGGGGYEDLFFGGGNGPAKSRHHGRGQHHSPPRHVSERTEVLRGAGYDPRFGAVDIHRVYRREEWPRGSSVDGGDGGYFRVVAQDFVLEGGYYPGDLRYVPISDPSVIEEGYVEGRYGTGTGRGEGDGGGGSRRSEHAATREGPKDRLTEDEFMTHGSEPLQSANGRYAAYLTPHCELVIVRIDEEVGRGGGAQIIWGSDTFYPKGRCFLSLYGPRIGIFAGEHPDDQRGGGAQGLIWVSPMGEDEYYDLEETLMPGDEGGEYSSYYLSLDDDGSLAVYRKGSGVEGQRHSGHSHVGGKALRATARRVRRLWYRMTSKLPPGDNDGSAADERGGDEDKCVYATGVAGCATGGRRIVATGADVGRKLRRSWEQMGRVARNLADVLSDDEDEDEDAFDAVVRVLGIVARNLVRGGAEAGRWGVLFARRGFREGKNVTKLLGHRISETMQKWAKVKR